MKLGADTISTKDAAELLMIDERHVRRLAAEGWFSRSKKGRYATVPIVQGFVRSLQERRKANTRVAAENRVREARARHIEIKTARLAGELGSIDELEEVMVYCLGDHHNECVGLGAAVTRDLDLRRKIDNAVAATFARTNDKIAKRLATLREYRSSAS